MPTNTKESDLETLIVNWLVQQAIYTLDKNSGNNKKHTHQARACQKSKTLK